LDAGHAQEVQGLEVPGIEAQHRLVDAARVVLPPGLMQGPPLLAEGV
jgi:hypothetical protein